MQKKEDKHEEFQRKLVSTRRDIDERNKMLMSKKAKPFTNNQLNEYKMEIR